MQMMFCFVMVTLVTLCHQSLGVEELNSATTAQIAQILQNASSKSLEYVGAYDGKIYFTDPKHMTWSSANEYCENDSMKLVTLRNPTEVNYLAARLPSDYTYWWTSATDTNEYYWPNGVMVDLDVPTPHPNCVVIKTLGPAAEPCSGTEHSDSVSYYPLCEALSG